MITDTCYELTESDRLRLTALAMSTALEVADLEIAVFDDHCLLLQLHAIILKALLVGREAQ